ncbi:MAG: hypothetical protein V4646_12550 [Pseudomonadota bacterium]
MRDIERIAGQLHGQTIGVRVHDLVRQSAKMGYVGFSRPTHLLRFSVHQSRFAKFDVGIDRNVWKVVLLGVIVLSMQIDTVASK